MDFLQSIGILDLVFIAILVISTVIGLIRGAVREVLSLVGLAISIYLAFKFADVLSNNYISKFFEQQPQISYIIAFIIIIVASIFAIALINILISQLLKVSGLSFVDRFLGLVFGVLRGGLFCAILTMVINFIPGSTQADWWKKSNLAPFFQNVASYSSDYIPDSVKNYFNKDRKNNQSTQTGKDSGAKEEIELVLQSIGEDNTQATQQPDIQLEIDTNPETTPESTELKIDLQSIN